MALDQVAQDCLGLGTEADSPLKEGATSDQETKELTKAMLDEEENLHSLTVKEEEREQENVKEALAKENEKLHEMRFQRLEFLLKKSSMYTTYLLSRIKQQEDEEKTKLERKRKRLQKKQEKSRKDRQLQVKTLRSKNGPVESNGELISDEDSQAASQDNLLQVDEVKTEKTSIGGRRSMRSQKNTPLNSPSVRKSARSSAKNSPHVKETKGSSTTNIPQSMTADPVASRTEPGSPGSDKENEQGRVKGRKRKADASPERALTSDILAEAARRVKKQRTEDSQGDSETPLSSQVSSSAATEDEKEAYESRCIGGEEVPIQQPNLFSGGILRHYQVEGYKWLRIIYENGINGILADEMGLGKTIQCIALVAHLIENGIEGPFLVVAPLSTIPNWLSEFKRFAPTIPTVLYHGTKEERATLRHKKLSKRHVVQQKPEIRSAPVVVTSYEIAMIDRRHIADHEWKLIIVDEGHRLKNFQCRLIRELKVYRTTHRLLLTGTPLQNNLSELWSLLNFLLPEIFDDLSSFETWFDVSLLQSDDSNQQIVQAERHKSVLTMLHNILNPFMLRRMKGDVSLDVPPKREVLVYAPMAQQQQRLYKAIVDRSITQLVDKNAEPEKPVLDEKGRPKRKVKNRINIQALIKLDNYSSQDEDSQEIERWCDDLIQLNQPQEKEQEEQQEMHYNVKMRNVMMMLRKCTNHPYLVEYPLHPDGSFKIDESLANASGKLMMLDCMLRELKARGHKVLLFSQMTKMLDILEDFCYLRKYSVCRLDGSMKFEDRREQIESFNTDPEMFIFLLSTRAGGLGLNLTAADTCIIYDSDWNPQNDLQAQDRCHRIGQTKPVMVYRLVTAGTIDQRIVERAAAKRKLEKMVIQKGRFKDASLNRMTKQFSAISPEELLELLESTDYHQIVSGRNSSVINKKTLDSLLDRSELYDMWRNKGSGKDNKKLKGKKEEESEKEGGVFKILDEDSTDNLVTA